VVDVLDRDQADEVGVREARAGRLLPGEGELPLGELLAALPDGIPVAVEAPSASASPERLLRASFALAEAPEAFRASRDVAGKTWIRMA
jgi:hypothetical protein